MSHADKMAARLVDMPYMLAERPYTQKELVDHFKTDRKTIKNDINTLKKRHKITETRRWHLAAAHRHCATGHLDSGAPRGKSGSADCAEKRIGGNYG
jgi:hypothetical protein